MNRVLVLSLTYSPLLLSLLSFYPTPHLVLHFLRALAPLWFTCLSARWYVRLAERSSPLYHPLGCLTQCCIWVFHWVVLLYHAVFVTRYSFWAYLVTLFCAGIVFISEGLFHHIVMTGFSDTTHLGAYDTVRKIYGRGLIFFLKLWFLVDLGTSKRQNRGRLRRPMQSRSMTM